MKKREIILCEIGLLAAARGGAEIDLQTVQGKGKRKFSRRTFHSLRHSFSSALANAGISEEVRMRLTGHSSRDIHAHYTHLNIEPLKNAITMLPKLGV